MINLLAGKQIVTANKKPEYHYSGFFIADRKCCAGLS